MAEAVHKLLENAAEELREFLDQGLFREEEVRSIAQQRVRFEYALRKRIAAKVDYLRYIQYELNLEQLRRKRKQQLGIHTKNSPSEYSIVRRLHFLFGRALKKFKNDVVLWMQYFQFCKETASTRMLGKAFATALSYNPLDARLWVEAAKYEFEENANVRAARALLQRGLRYQPQSRDLWLEYFRLELLAWEKVVLRRQVLGIDDASESAAQRIVAGELPLIAFRNAIKAIPDDFDFRVSFLDIYNHVPGTEDGRAEVIKSLKQDFANDPRTWDTVARQQRSPVAGVAVYKAAMAEAESSSLVEKYGDFLLDSLREARDSASIAEVMESFDEANKEGHAQAPLLEAWTRALTVTGQISAAATHANSIGDAQWANSLRQRAAVAEGKVLPHAPATPVSKGNAAWVAWADHVITAGPPKAREELLKMLTSRAAHEVVAVETLWMCLGWSAAKKAAAATRSPDVLSALVSIEQLQPKPSLKHLRDWCNAALQANQNSHEHWLALIGVELRAKDFIGAKQTYARACRSLDNAPEFQAKYALLLAGTQL